MPLNSLLSLIGFMAFALLISWAWDKKINWDKKNRKHFSEKFFYVFFGFTALFLALDNWVVLSEFQTLSMDDKTSVNPNGIGSFFQWWGIYAFILGLFAGITTLSFIYKRIAQTARRLNLFSFYHFLKVRYPGGKWFVSLIAKIGLVAAVPFIYYQISLSARMIFPEMNSYLAIAAVSATFIGIFLFVNNKSQKLSYFISFIFALMWIIFGFYHTAEQSSDFFFSTTGFWAS